MSLRSRLRMLLTFGRGVVVRGLPEADEHADPLELFGAWFEAARESGLHLPEACALATVSPDGAPSCRMVLLKSFDERGFVFFTNYGSRKARELEANPRAALLFHWNVLERQARVEGTVARISPEESEAYFRTRSRGSRLGAWASRQSEALGGRAELEARFREVEERFRGREVPLPTFWGGYRLRASRMEFWQGRANRLHDRVRFDRDEEGEGWRATRLHP